MTMKKKTTKSATIIPVGTYVIYFCGNFLFPFVPVTNVLTRDKVKDVQATVLEESVE